MTQPLKFPETLQETMAYFSDHERALAFMVSFRWPDGKPTCPDCGSIHSSFISTRAKWKCMACHRQYSAKVGTIFEDSALGYDKWFPAMWLVANCKNGISSYELAKDLGVSQKTAWFMLHRIRFALQSGSITKLKGDVEVDETYIGGKARFMHKDRNERRGHGTGYVGKQIVVGLLERDGRVVAKHLRRNRRKDLFGEIKATIEPGSTVHTDALPSYEKMPPEYIHEAVDHAVECGIL